MASDLGVVGESATLQSNAGRMLLVLAHELRGPLAPIRNAATSLAMHIPEGAPSRKSVRIIERQLKNIESLIDGILEAARLEHALQPVHRVHVNLVEAVADAIDAATPYVTERGHMLGAVLPSTPVYVDGDAGQLGQIVHNLLTNAAKYTDRGGCIEVSVTSSGDTARICVRDTGIGVMPDKQASIFDLFAQAGQGGTPRSAGGLGIGLYVTRQLVLGHGGTISVASPGLNLGSEFTVRLPLACTGDGETWSAAQSPNPAVGGPLHAGTSE